MSDPREVDARCNAQLQGPDLMLRYTYICTFRAEHGGLHSGQPLNREFGTPMTGPTLRWGTEEQLADEALLLRARARDTAAG